MAKQNINVGTAANDKKGDSLRAAFQKVNSNFTELYTALGINADGNLNIGAFEFAGSVMSTTDSTAIVIDQATTISSNLTVGGDVLPSVANGGNLGSSTLPWRSLYVSNNTIYIGGTAVGVDANGALTTGGTVVGSTPAWANITGKPTFATVATTGAYADLTGKPTIPTLVSQLANDSGFLTSVGNISNIQSESDVSIQVNLTDSTIRIWRFGEDGNLTLPQGGNISEGGGISGAIRLTPSGGANEYQALLIYPTAGEGDHIHLTAGGGTTELYLGNDLHFVKLESDGNIRIQADNGVNGAAWTFGTDGSLQIPGDIKSNGNINIDINLADSTLRRWQFGEDGILTLPSVGKISNGAYDWTFGSTGITTFPGVINAGNINNLVVSDAGGGTSLTAGSQVQIGNSAGIAGAGVLIKNAVTNTLGGETSLEQGSKIQMDNGIVSLSGYDYNSLGGGEGLEFQMVVEVENNYPNKVVRIGTRIINTGVEPPTNVFQGVTISQYGDITFPDNTVQSTAYNPSNIRSEGNINIDINLSDSTLRRWSFGEDGELTFPDGTSQSTAYQVTKSITHTSNLLAGPSSFGQGSSIAITDNYQTERVSITNSLGGIARATLANITVIGKIVILTSTSPHETYVDRYGWSGATQSYVTVSNNGNGVVILMSLGSNGWKLISSNE